MGATRTGTLRLAHGRTLAWRGGRPLLMGILNVTPDSFSDGGRFAEAGRAIEQARRMVAEGAAIIDVGGESSRPGAAPVDAEEEARRVLPVIEAMAAVGWAEVETENGARGAPLISIDTTKAEVARRAVAAGAHLINDISAGSMDAAMLEVAAETGAALCLMHMRGTPATMQRDPRYDDVVREVGEALAERVRAAEAAGVARAAILVDPGIGFGKTLEHNVALVRGLARVTELAGTDLPLLVGVSRKSFLGRLAGIEDAAARDGVTQVAHAACAAGGAAILRVHDVAMARSALAVAGALSPFAP